MTLPPRGTFPRAAAVPIAEHKSDPALAHALEPTRRVAIEHVWPVVDGGVFSARSIVGTTEPVEADIFADGHTTLRASVFVRREDEAEWRPTPMRPIGNDRWRAEILFDREGRHCFFIEAWLDVYGGFVSELRKKRDAGQNTALDVAEGRALILAARTRVNGSTRDALAAIADGLQALDGAACVNLLMTPEAIAAMAAADDRPFRTASKVKVIDVQRQRAGFGSWYELFPRSQAPEPGRHGTLRDVQLQLPRIAAMGFDVLYLPPIHPIGTTNRKGRNNALTAGPEDPGSPYAIGSHEGGHDAIHPQLGTIADFRELVEAARVNGMEIALDFAVQCSPDHPWLKEHPDWFDWRSDGSIRFAENPPKKYEDIVNVDFYANGAMPDLWLALRDVVLVWIERGVHIFRVDNPHTKPLPFWEWLIADIRRDHPETIFLSEAFTRPHLMQRLAKLCFTQSYTYFTWRNTKAELTEYLTELTTSDLRCYFRPNFFVNTPDILPAFLQSGGRGAFLIRAALAATLSGSWGVYSGFELCEAEALPGREEYRNSEKYEIKHRDWHKQGHIAAEITALNRIRRREPHLESHLGLTFYNAFNDHILYYARTVRGRDDRLLVMVSLDPQGAQECDFEVPLWEWRLPDHESVLVEDLLTGHRFVWTGKIQHVRLEPSAPYRIWRIEPARAAHA